MRLKYMLLSFSYKYNSNLKDNACFNKFDTNKGDPFFSPNPYKTKPN